MSKLPKINLPKYELKLFTMINPVTYRVFTVGEQKQLLLAKESDKLEDKIQAIKNTVKTCTFGTVDVDNLAFFDLETLFLRIRSKSVSNQSQITFKVKDSKTKIKVDINLDDVGLKVDESHSKTVWITDTIGMNFKYPSIAMMYKAETEQTNMVFECLESIFDGDVLTSKADITKEEFDEFIDGFDPEHLSKVKKFFDTIPRLEHEIEIKYLMDEKEVVEKIKLVGLNDFFG